MGFICCSEINGVVGREALITQGTGTQWGRGDKEMRGYEGNYFLEIFNLWQTSAALSCK